jgi:hypothetical protein
VLFLSLAYMAAALDQTGAFNWLALKTTRAAATGRRLFALHTLLAGAVTLGTRCGGGGGGRGGSARALAGDGWERARERQQPTPAAPLPTLPGAAMTLS